MDLRTIVRSLHRPSAGLLALALGANLASMGSGIPCLADCLARAETRALGRPTARDADGCGDDGDRAGGHGHCPRASVCDQDPTAAEVVRPTSAAPPILAVAILHGDAGVRATPGASPARRHAALDRGPPIPPAFEIHRP